MTGQLDIDRWGPMDPNAKKAYDVKQTWIPIAETLGFELLRWHSDGNRAQFKKPDGKTLTLTRKEAETLVNELDQCK